MPHQSVPSPEQREQRRQYLHDYHIRRLAAMTPEEFASFRKHSNEVAKKSWNSKDPAERSAIYKRRYEKYKAQTNAKARQWRAQNRERVAAYNKAWAAANQDKVIAHSRATRSDPEKKKSRNVGLSERYRSDARYRAEVAVRTRINTVLRRRKLLGWKSDRATALLGCSIDELMVHLEKQFKPGMTWENHGAWHIDHIVACKKFDLTDPEQQRACFHFSNLQPLWAADNIRKHAK